MNSEQIKKLREYLELTQEEFVKILGIHYCSVFLWETSKSTPEGMPFTYISVMQDLIENGKG